MNFGETPEFVAFVEHLGEILEAYPEARLAVFRAVEALDRRSEHAVIDGQALDAIPEQLEDSSAV